MNQIDNEGGGAMSEKKELLGESWTTDELWDARHVLMAIYEGVDVHLTVGRMDELAARGLVHDVTRLPGRGRYANRFTFQWHDKLEQLFHAAAAAGVYSSPT
jgi:nuclear transport factor 2 (NTF2) superfamily protein